MSFDLYKIILTKENKLYEKFYKIARMIQLTVV